MPCQQDGLESQAPELRGTLFGDRGFTEVIRLMQSPQRKSLLDCCPYKTNTDRR